MITIYGSSRENGNTEELAKAVLKDINTEEVYLRRHTINPITDMRHDELGFTNQQDDYYDIAKKMAAHDTILFVTPLYWYGMSGLMKNFVDRWSERIRDSTIKFKEQMKNKRVYVVVVGCRGASVIALPPIMLFQYIVDFIGSSFSGYIIGEANAPGDIAKDVKAQKQAIVLNQELKQL
ncbi:flavodoxin family protein [Bacillus megaterium NBRC 15308 = ATCC 14581]|nr:flavodoxin family protein [Priestia megaterium NBRC 15308 = ATCC 14581]